MKRVLFALAILFSIKSFAQQKSVLFLGNSYVYTANLPGTLYNLALAGGDTIYHESNTPGGYTLEGHSTNATSLTKIASREWDFVVLQEQSQKPSFPPAQVAAETYPYAEILVDSIKSNYECTEPIFFMTWGRRDGDQQNCQFYTPLCTFEGMNARLRESYLEMGADNDATVAPCGAAWQQMKLQNSTFWNGLYSGDGSHPSAWGTYLNACIFYATIFRQSPVGIPYYSSIGQQDAEDLQQLAEDMVLDSLNNWYIGHQDEAVADFTFEGEGGFVTGPVQFENNSDNAIYHTWDFGDGGSSNEQQPIHEFDQGIWTVTYTATSCIGDTSISTSVVQVPLSVDEKNPLEDVDIQINDRDVIITGNKNSSINLTIFDFSGKAVMTEQIGSNSSFLLNLSLSSGFYLIHIEDGKNQSSRKLFLR